jgi:uncharacterized delta-60 repeat protein
MLRPILVWVALIATVSTSFAQLDNSFLPVISDFPRVTVSAIQPDGKVIVAGQLSTADNIPVKSLIRLNADGSLDNTFQSAVPENILIYTCIVDNNSKILVGGWSPTTQAFLWRLNADGSKDESFTLSTQLTEQVAKIAALADGRYLVLHFKQPYISRLNANGSVDTSFNPGTGLGGIAIHDNEIAVQPDGKAIIVGQFGHTMVFLHEALFV